MLSMLRQSLERFADKWRYQLPERSLDELKQICRVLFIDDGEFAVPEILKRAGWLHTRMIEDVDSLEDSLLADAHIVFVDIGGVGKKLQFSDQGLGLITAIRKKYPSKKLVVYSAERRGDRFHQGLSVADERLRKNADPFEFQSLTEELAKQAFCLSECLARLQIVLRNDFRVHLSDEEVARRLRRIGGSKDFTEGAIEQVFNIQNAGSVASMISLFLRGG